MADDAEQIEPILPPPPVPSEFIDPQSNRGIAPSIIAGFILALVAMGLPLIGVTVNIYLGALILLTAFVLFAYGFGAGKQHGSGAMRLGLTPYGF